MKKPSKELVSQLLPNTFPFPNIIIDEQEVLGGRNIWSFLEAPEQALLPIVYRKTFGWWKRVDNISQSQLVQLTGLGLATVREHMRSLEQIGLVMNIKSENSNDGMAWSPQTDSDKIDFAFLIERAEAKKAVNHRRIRKARRIRRANLHSEQPLLSHNSPIVAQQEGAIVAQQVPPIVAQQVQKPVKPKKDIPLRLSIENQIAAGMTTVVPDEVALLKQAVTEAFGINVKWGSAAAPKLGISPLDFMSWMLTEKVTVEQIQRAGKVWTHLKKYGWRSPTISLIWENWKLLLKEKLPEDEQQEVKQYWRDAI